MRAVALVLLGAFLGVVGALLQARQTHVAGLLLPTGMVLVVVALVLVARACAWWVGSRWGALALSAGWLAATLGMATRTPGGDLVLTSGTRQLAYLVGASMLLAAASAFPLVVARQHEPATSAPAPSEQA